MALVLIGAPGSGKSSVARALADGRLRLRDTDDDLAERYGGPVGECFVAWGAERFAAQEAEAALAALAEADVVALGSAAVLHPGVAAALNDHDVVWLDVDAARAGRRKGLNAVQPTLFGNARAMLVRHLAERRPHYERLADVRVDTVDRDVTQIAHEIAALERPFS